MGNKRGKILSELDQGMEDNRGGGGILPDLDKGMEVNSGENTS